LAYEYYLRAELAAGRGALEKARRWLRAALREDPGSPDLRLRIAQLWLREGRREAALAQVRAAQRTAPEHALTRVMHARLLRRTAPARARRLLEQAARLRPKLAAVHLERARLARWMRRPRRERVALRAVLRHHPEHAAALRALARLARRLGRDREAARWLTALQRVTPFAVYPRLALARLWLARGRPHRAARVLQRALEATADDLEVARELFRLWLSLRRRHRAEDLVRLLEAHEAAAPLTFAAGLRARLGQWERAEALLARARRQDPGYGPALVRWARWQVRRRGPAAAATLLRAVPADRDTYVEAQVELAALREAQGEAAAARLGLRQALQKRPGEPALWEALAHLLARHQRLDAAQRALERARRQEGLAPTDPSHRYRRTLLLLDGGALTEALATARRLVREDPADPERLNLLGYSLVERGLRRPEATRLLERAHRLDPLNPFILDSLAWARYQGQRVGAAITLLERAVRIDPWMLEAWHHLGDVRRAAGQRAGARAAYRAALRGHPPAWVEATLRGKLRLLAGPALRVIGEPRRRLGRLR
jgi:predicted Zn-dependent protease